MWGADEGVAFAINYHVVDRNIDHLKFVAEKPPPLRIFAEIALIAAEERAEYF